MRGWAGKFVQALLGGACVALAVIAVIHTSFTASLSDPLMLSPVGKTIAWLLLVPLGLVPLSLARPRLGLAALVLLGGLLSVLVALGYGVDLRYLPRLDPSRYPGHGASTPAEQRGAAFALISQIWQYYGVAAAFALAAWMVGQAGQSRAGEEHPTSVCSGRSFSTSRPRWLWLLTGAVSSGLSHWAVSAYEVNRFLDASVGYLKWPVELAMFLVLLIGPQALFLGFSPSLAGKWIAYSVLGWIVGNAISMSLFGTTGLAWLTVPWQWQESKSGDPLATILAPLFPSFLVTVLALGVAQGLLLASIGPRSGLVHGWTLRTIAGLGGFWLIVVGYFITWSAMTPAGSLPGLWLSISVFLVGGALYGVATEPQLRRLLEQRVGKSWLAAPSR